MLDNVKLYCMCGRGWFSAHLTGTNHHITAATIKQASSMYLAPEKWGLGDSLFTNTVSVRIPRVAAEKDMPTQRMAVGRAGLIGRVRSVVMSRAIGMARNAMTLMHMRQA